MTHSPLTTPGDARAPLSPPLVGLLLITHHGLGEALLHTARSMLGHDPLQCVALACSQHDDPDDVEHKARRLAIRLDEGRGLLIFTDIFGSTPANVAVRVAERAQARVIAGINLPMLIRVLNYRQLDRPDLINKALSGGHDGILLCDERCQDAQARSLHR